MQVKTFSVPLIVLAVAVVLPCLEALAEPICQDSRERMECGNGSETEQTGNLIVNLQFKLKELIDAGGRLENQKQIEVDVLLERFKEINKRTCSMWNACLDQALWHEFYLQFTEVLLKGDNITKQKGVEDQIIQEFIDDMAAVSEFYERGIGDVYKNVQSD